MPYRPTDARSCRLGGVRRAGPGAVLGVWVAGTSCRIARRVVARYQRCLNSESGRDGRCYGRVDKRCVRPTFLGRCWISDRFFRRRIDGYDCTERRLHEIEGIYEGRVICGQGRRRVSHRYTLFTGKPVSVDTESELRAAWGNPGVTAIDVTADIFLRACERGDPMRESGRPVLLDGRGHTLRQTCFEKRLLRQDGTGFVELRNVTLTRGGSDGPGAAVTTRGEIKLVDSKVFKNLSEEPGGGIMSQRRATIVRSVITGNLANDDGGGVYARRGGVQVYDSIVNGNLVDGSGGAIGSTGDILVVRSHVDGNTTDGDGGALYADEDGDVTVIDSTVDGSTADGPGGAIFTLDGDVTIVNSTVNGNRADDRGGAISGESDVTIINSTIARNAAVAHVGGGVWARGNLYVANSTISNNYAEGLGGGVFAAGTVGLVKSTIIDNIAPAAANVAAGERLDAFGSIIGPAKLDPNGGQAQPTARNCQVPQAQSFGFNFITDASCGLYAPTDVMNGKDPMLGELAANGGLGETRQPQDGSPVIDRIPAADCSFAPFGDVLEGEQHLEGLVADRLALAAMDQRGVLERKGPPVTSARWRSRSDASIPIQAHAISRCRRPVRRRRRGLRARRIGHLRRQPPGKRRRRGLTRRLAVAAHEGTAPESARGATPTRRPCRAGRADGGVRGRLRGLADVSQICARQRAGRPRSPIRLPLRRARRHRRGIHGRARRRPRRRPGREDYMFIHFRGDGCQSDSPQPGGTAEPASVRAASARSPGLKRQVQMLERKATRLARRARRLQTMSERFDEWESCVSWVPVTEMGDPDQKFGYLFGPKGGPAGYRAALHVDRSDWDDPDYMFLALVGGDRPGRHCQDEPGEAVD